MVGRKKLEKKVEGRLHCLLFASLFECTHCSYDSLLAFPACVSRQRAIAVRPRHQFRFNFRGRPRSRCNAAAGVHALVAIAGRPPRGGSRALRIRAGAARRLIFAARIYEEALQLSRSRCQRARVLVLSPGGYLLTA